MEVREEEAVTAEGDGVLYYFGSEGCRDKFLKERTCARTAYDLIIIGGGRGPEDYRCNSIIERQEVQ